MKYLVLGSGLQGRAIAYDLLEFDKGSHVFLGDINENNLKEAEELIRSKDITTEKIDVFDIESTASLISKVDVAINSLPHPWEYSENFYKACIRRTRVKALFTDYWEWGKHYEYDEELKKAKSLVIPGLGIVPGFGNICVGQLSHEFDQLEEGAIYCGGLPVEKGVLPLDYMILFNVEALLDIYLTDPKVILDGETVVEKHLQNFETFLIPGYGQVDAMKTDGLYSLNKTLKEKGVKRLYEATLRYPGHYQAMQLLEKSGFFDKQPIEVNGVKVSPRKFSEAILNKAMKKIPGVRDFTYLLVRGKGLKDGKYTEKSYEVLDYSDEEVGLTSMERTTAYPSSIAAIMLAHEDMGMYGIVEPEKIFIGNRFEKMVRELAKRHIMVYEK
jgi:lysine 6-dehydrogenase